MRVLCTGTVGGADLDDWGVAPGDDVRGSVLGELSKGKNRNPLNKRGFNLIGTAVLEKTVGEIYQAKMLSDK